MLEKDEKLINLFRKISKIHYLTDYSSIDHLYPPHFAWDKFDNNKFIKRNFFSGNYSLYVHFPFCLSKCKFCRQFSMVNKNKFFYQEYVNLLIQELNLYTKRIKINSLIDIYLGGGTPTLFPLKKFFDVLNLYKPHNQINIESTPESLNYQKLKLFKKIGVNRLLIGIQSLDPNVLRLMNRPQRKLHFIRIYNIAKKIGIPNINLELIAGLPRQTLKSFLNDLKTIIKLKPESIHVYKYINSPKTLFYKQKYQKNQKEKKLEKEMLTKGIKILLDANYFFRGDDYYLNDNLASRNQSLKYSNQDQRVHGQISLGLSAIGALSLKNDYLLRTINTIDYKEYKKRIIKKEFPIEKEFLLNRYEEKRACLIRDYRYGDLEKLLKKSCDPAIDFLKRQGKIKIRHKVWDTKIILSIKDFHILSKIFYSSKVLKKCNQIIKDQY